MDYIVDPNNPDQWGVAANPYEFPWMVAVWDGCEFVTKSSCGGILISPKLVMSASHCMRCDPAGRDNIAYALLGVHRWTASYEGGVSDTWKKLFGEIPSYDVIPIINKLVPTTVAKNDFTILVLGRPAPLSSRVCPLLLPNEDEDVDKSPATIAGWGGKEHKGESSLVLRKCDTIIDSINHNKNECNSVTNPKTKKSDTECYKFILDKTGQNACLGCGGDSG